jgi:hypothetical protein
MTLAQAIFYYAVFFLVLLVALIWLWLRRKVKSATSPAESPRRALWISRFDWKASLALRPQQWLTGAMWIKVLLAALVALSAGVIIVVFFFPLGAAWAAATSFIAVVGVVGLLLMLME